mmetsp:Transcript_51007/g.125348  ORF Transcript_51007/g.125348 Transcript_51007/m.125348 type:complete len:287 (+) Transcript_51007:360-1220(+)
MATLAISLLLVVVVASKVMGGCKENASCTVCANEEPEFGEGDCVYCAAVTEPGTFRCQGANLVLLSTAPEYYANCTRDCSVPTPTPTSPPSPPTVVVGDSTASGDTAGVTVVTTVLAVTFGPIACILILIPIVLYVVLYVKRRATRRSSGQGQSSERQVEGHYVEPPVAPPQSGYSTLAIGPESTYDDAPPRNSSTQYDAPPAQPVRTDYDQPLLRTASESNYDAAPTTSSVCQPYDDAPSKPGNDDEPVYDDAPKHDKEPSTYSAPVLQREDDVESEPLPVPPAQ